MSRTVLILKKIFLLLLTLKQTDSHLIFCQLLVNIILRLLSYDIGGWRPCYFVVVDRYSFIKVRRFQRNDVNDVMTWLHLVVIVDIHELGSWRWRKRGKAAGGWSRGSWWEGAAERSRERDVRVRGVHISLGQMGSSMRMWWKSLRIIHRSKACWRRRWASQSWRRIWRRINWIERRRFRQLTSVESRRRRSLPRYRIWCWWH